MKLTTQQKLSFEETIADVLGEGASDQWDVQGWFPRHKLEVKDRTKVLRKVFLDSDPQWRKDFIVMLVLSGGIATLGLSQDSAATVIGSMIVAPLGAPIVALGGAIAVGWYRETIKMLATVITGAAIVVMVAYLVGMLLPNNTPTEQILARTAPDLRDLGVAILAGAAGAYAQTSSSLSHSLVGVAIAVALVPPLATVGLMLEEGRMTLATGAFMLFAANLVGIVLAVATTLLITRYAPFPKLRHTSVKLILGFGITIFATILVTIPLTITYRKVAQTTQIITTVNSQVSNTLDTNDSVAVVENIHVQDNHVIIDLSDTTMIPSAEVFEADLVDELGSDVTVEIE